NELGVSIRANTEEWQVYGTGPTLVELIDITGTRMITWNKLRALRTKTLKGRKAKWFSIIKKKVIRYMESREIIDRFKSPDENSMFMQTNARKLSDDRRRR
ncbi:16668_t:CDS:2, partial [Dentiscutata heterogama]